MGCKAGATVGRWYVSLMPAQGSLNGHSRQGFSSARAIIYRACCAFPLRAHPSAQHHPVMGEPAAYLQWS